MFWLKFILIAGVTCLADVCWTLYFISVSDKHAFKAAFWSACIILCSAINVIGYTENVLFILASFIGAFIGTYLTVKFKK